MLWYDVCTNVFITVATTKFSLPIFCPDLIRNDKLGQENCFCGYLQLNGEDKCTTVLRKQSSNLVILFFGVRGVNPPLTVKFLGPRLPAQGGFKTYLQSIRYEPLGNSSKSRSKLKMFVGKQFFWWWKMAKILHSESCCSSGPSSWTMLVSIEILAKQWSGILKVT